MIPLIEEKRAEIEALCRRYHVATLEVFGSAATGEFDEARSDFDFLVRLQPLDPVEHARSFFGLQRDMEKLMGRRVDLVPIRAIRNPYFLKSVNETRRALYAA